MLIVTETPSSQPLVFPERRKPRIAAHKRVHIQTIRDVTRHDDVSTVGKSGDEDDVRERVTASVTEQPNIRKTRKR